MYTSISMHDRPKEYLGYSWPGSNVCNTSIGYPYHLEVYADNYTAYDLGGILPNRCLGLVRDHAAVFNFPVACSVIEEYTFTGTWIL